MTRLEKVFDKKGSKNKVLVTYTVAGDPSLTSSKKILNDLIASGSDILEIGVPFSDPMSEGPVIQKAHERALKKNIQLDDILNLCKQIRDKNSNVPIVLMGYMNSFLSLKLKLAEKLNKAGVDGVIVVDLPYDESKSFFNKLTALYGPIKSSYSFLPLVFIDIFLLSRLIKSCLNLFFKTIADSFE